MRSHKRILGLLLAVIIFAVAATVATVRGQGQSSLDHNEQQSFNAGQLPVVGYAAPEPAEPEKCALRRIRGSRHTRGNKQLIKELTSGIEELPLNSHWWWGLPAIPAANSDVIVVGEVIYAQAYLSNDKTAVYSEFTIRTDAALKNNSSTPLDNTIVAERPGGAVRFQSGRIQHYRIDKQGVAQVGHRYLFFLKRNEEGQDFSILTGYELRAGRVFALDSTGDNSNNKLPFDDYNGCEESTFLNKVRNAIANPSQVLPEKGVQN